MTAPALVGMQPPAALAGRAAELRSLTEALDSALSGEPRIVVLMGDAGVGKSRLARELHGHAAARAMQVCAGRFLEGGAVPHSAFVDALAPRLRDALPAATGAARAEIETTLRILTASGDDPVAGQGHEPPLHRALPHAVAALAARRPLLLVVDDLHWAEPGALQAFLHLAIGLVDLAADADLRVCLLTICRPPEPDDPLARVLERLRREPAVTTIALGGLPEIDLNDLVREAAGATCSPALLHRLQDATGGNPLLALETLTALSERGVLATEDGQLTAGFDPAALPLPRELSRAIAARVESLPVTVARPLAFAALAGDEFTVASLAHIAAISTDAALDVLDDAVSRRFVVPAGEGFRFAHPLVRRVLADSLPPHRRGPAHATIAARLAAGGNGSAIGVAHHLLAAGAAAEPALIGRYASVAGVEALATNAWGEAARYFEAALAAPGYLAALEPAGRARLLYNAAFAHYRDLDVPRMRDRFADAIEAFRECGDLRGWAESLEGWIRSYISHGVLGGEPLDEHPYEEFMAAAGEREPHARALVMCEWAEALYSARRPECHALAAEALDIARQLGDPYLLLHAEFALGLASLLALDVPAAARHFANTRAAAFRLDDPWLRCWPMQNLPVALFSMGRLDDADERATEIAVAAREAHDWAINAFAVANRVSIAAARGDFDAVERLAREAGSLIARSDYSWAAPLVYCALTVARAARGQWAEAADAANFLVDATGHAGAWPYGAFVRIASGETSAVRSEIEARPGIAFWRAEPNSTLLAAIAPRIEVAKALAMPTIAEFPESFLASAARGGFRFVPGPGYSIDRLRAEAALLLGLPGDARDRFDDAIRSCRDSGARAELVRGLLGFAALPGLAAAERDAALAEAASLARELGMAPALVEAAALAAAAGFILPPPPPSPYPGGLSETAFEVLLERAAGREPDAIARNLLLSPRTVAAALVDIERLGIASAEEAAAFAALHGLGPSATVLTRRAGAARELVFMFADIVDSTPVIRAVGDEAWTALLLRHDEILQAAVAASGGTYVKHLGDGAFASFPHAASALECAHAVQDRFPLEAPGGALVRLRMGLHAGTAIPVEGDLFGLAVSLASRVCGRAAPGEVLVSDAVRAAATGLPLAFEDRGRVALKGFDERVRLFATTPLPRSISPTM